MCGATRYSAKTNAVENVHKKSAISTQTTSGQKRCEAVEYDKTGANCTLEEYSRYMYKNYNVLRKDFKAPKKGD